MKNNAPAVAYTADGKLHCSRSVLAENVIGRAVYGRLPGTTADSFIWNADGALHDEAGNTVPVEGLGRGFVIVGDSIYFNQSNGASANLAVLQYDAANKHWSAPILLTATEILSAQHGDSSVTEEIACMHDSARALCAFYDATGRLLRTVIQPLESGKINSLTFRIDSNAAQAKLFVLDAKNAPAAPARSIPLNS